MIIQLRPCALFSRARISAVWRGRQRQPGLRPPALLAPHLVCRADLTAAPAPSALPLRHFIQLAVLQASAAVPSPADGRRDQIGGARVNRDTVQRRVRLDLTAMLLGSQQGDHLIE
jgi:hypothetical protein